MNAWTIAWLVWLVAFCVIEGLALYNRTPGDTLSEHVWRWLMPCRGARAWRIRRFALLSFMAWLSLHFLTEGRF